MPYDYQNTINAFHVLAKQWQDSYMDLDLYDDTYDAFCALCEKPENALFEIGCGPGNIARYILQHYSRFRIYGIDAAPAMVELARENNPAARFEVMDCSQISTLPGPFDGVICGFCLPYLARPDAEKLIQDVSGLLASNGAFYLSTIEDDYARSQLQTSSNGQHSTWQFYYRETDLLDMLSQNNFMVTHTFRKVLQKPDGRTETGLILIARKK
ncbi:MAG: class I SAM-dependent methyltransferase [Bacteroidetes bacterium]|nr:class I SAM-dependent methyltransferase [Bacteroidota bacterium]